MSYTRLVWAALACGALAQSGCGSDTGILVGVGRDPATVPAPSIDQLQFLVGTPSGAPNVYAKSPANPDITVDVSGRDLAVNPYKLLFHEAGAQSTSLMVVVLGLSGGQPVAMASFEQPQPFMSGLVLEHDLTLIGASDGNGFKRLGGCLIFGNAQLVDPTDPKCGGECATDNDCSGMPKPVCGSYVCDLYQCKVRCPNCTDKDGDGFGVGTGCAGPDCDDNDPSVTDTGARDCHDPSNPVGVGACRAGTQQCVAGTWGPCSGEVGPSGEACNGEDDDCNGKVDDGLGVFTCGVGSCAASVPACTNGVLGVCAPGKPAAADACDGGDENCDGVVNTGCGCVKVAPTGNDSAATGDNNATPFATVEAAVAWASAAGGATRPKTVCVASGAACSASATYDGVQLVMSNGIGVYGQYESTTWTRCSSSVTIFNTRVPEGVLFPSTITADTVLDGVTVNRAGATSAMLVAGVTVDGAKGARLNRVTISDNAAGQNVYGVNVINGADATITGSSILAGLGTVSSVGVRAQAARVTLRNNCSQVDGTNHCVVACNSTALVGLHGRSAYGPGESYAVLLDGAPGSLVASSALCSSASDEGAALRIRGDGSGVVVTLNEIQGTGGVLDSHGIWAEDCNDAAPWIVDNTQITTAGANVSTRADGIYSVGHCHPVIDSNQLIVGGSEGGVSNAIGVYCGTNVNGSSRCVILGNKLIQGSGGGVPPTSAGVHCDDAACMRVERNVINGHTGQTVYGLWLGRTGAFIDRNQIAGGCGTLASHGIFASDSFARVQNNGIVGGQCQAGGNVPQTFVALRVQAAPGGNELDVNGNDLDAQGPLGSPAGTCVGAALKLESSPAVVPSGAVGIFRNNILRAGTCSMRVDAAEADAAADPRIFDNNDLDPFGTPNALYVDEGATALMSIAAVNALGYSANISVDAGYVAYPNDLHLTASSLCRGAGTSAGAPAYDADGNPRSMPPDIGAY